MLELIQKLLREGKLQDLPEYLAEEIRKDTFTNPQKLREERDRDTQRSTQQALHQLSRTLAMQDAAREFDKRHPDLNQPTYSKGIAKPPRRLPKNAIWRKP
jgi:hypothetical protein